MYVPPLPLLNEGYSWASDGCLSFLDLIAPYKESPYINHDELAKYIAIGGVRIEDNVVVTNEGYRNLTTAAKTVEDVERLCSGN
jgi:Xaa-Pro dipeptidase